MVVLTPKYASHKKINNIYSRSLKQTVAIAKKKTKPRGK